VFVQAVLNKVLRAKFCASAFAWPIDSTAARVPAGKAAQVTPVFLPVGVALDEDRATGVLGGCREHADERVAVAGDAGDAALEDAATDAATREDAVVALADAGPRGPLELN
jgi:hypothetical protein